MFAWWLKRGMSARERALAAVGRYALALALVGVTFAVRAQLEPQFAGRPVLIVFFLPIGLAAAFGGLGPGLLATALVVAGIAWSIFPPIASLVVESRLDQFQLLLVAVGGALLAALFERVRRVAGRVTALELARRHDARLRDTLDGMIEGCQILDRDYRYVYLNKVAEAHARQPAAALLGRTMKECYPGIERTEMHRALRRCMEERSLERFENEFVYPDGERRWFELRMQPVDEGVFILSLDITVRMRNEIRLREQVLRLELLTRITRAIRERLDLASLYASVVRRLERDMPLDFAAVLLRAEGEGALRLAFVGQRNRQLLDARHWPAAERLALAESGLALALAGETVHEPNLTRLRGGVGVKLAEVGLRSMVAVPLAVEGRPFGVLLAARSRPESFSSGECEFLRQVGEHVALAAHETELHGALKRAYDDLRESREEVARQERLNLLGQMASGVAHDINNAIAPVRMLAELMLETERGLTPGGRDDLHTVVRAVDGVSRTIERLQQFYRKRDASGFDETVDLARVARHAVELASVRWREPALNRSGRVEVVTAFDAATPAVQGNEAELGEALLNLLFNSVDAMPSGGTLTLRTRPGTEPGSAVLEVADTGAGMDARTLTHCFEPFFTTKGDHGTGLGLAMVYGTAQRHASRIEVDSAPGRGTTFTWSFPPARPLPTPLAGAASATAAPLPRRGLRALVVDDDPLVLRALVEMLAADGHHVTAADCGNEGIALLARPPVGGFDIVITDLGMPDADGRAVARAAKSRSASLPVLLVTGWGRRAEMTRDDLPDVDRMLGKPPRLQELRAALAELCGAEDGPQPM